MNRRIVIALGVAGLAVVAWPASGADRDVQIRSIDFETGVVELFNFGDVDENLSGWRFCTHDNDQFRQYSGSSGLNGVVIESRTSLFIHFNNDGPSGSDDIAESSQGAVVFPGIAGNAGVFRSLVGRCVTSGTHCHRADLDALYRPESKGKWVLLVQ